jgi:DNA gyrase subunit A
MLGGLKLPETIIDANLYIKYHEDAQLFAVYASRKRAVPEYKDGLKPVHRKILYAMYADEKAITHTIKSASVVGTVIKKYHPHGDVPVYDAMKPMVNWFEINKPLIEKQGNFGTIQGSRAAAARYTEVKLSKFAVECVISELQETDSAVDWVPNYDGRYMEPEYLPTSVPLLLINGTLGIAPGMKVEIPRHNINDVIDATIQLIDYPDSQIELIPDTCMPCEIVKTNFKAISNKGFGNFIVRGIIDIEDHKGSPVLVIKTLPDYTFLRTIEDAIEKLIENKKVIQIVSAQDESSKGVLRYAIYLKKGSDPNYVKEVIYKSTEMQKKCRINFEVLDGVNVVRMSYKSYLQAFIEFRKLTKFRLYCNRLQSVQTDMHEMEMYIKVLQSGQIDTIINMIRKNQTVDDTADIEWLIKNIGVTDLQAKYILNMNLKKLSEGYLNQYIDKYKKLEVIKLDYIARITDDNVIIQEIKNELLDYKKKYGNPRRCKLISDKDASDIPQGEFKIVITENNFIKKILVNDAIGSFRNDTPKIVLKAENTENILIFDELGKVFKLPVHKIQFTDRNSPGNDIRFLIKNLTSNINTVMYEPMLKDFNNKQNKYFIVIITAGGFIKKLDINDFLTVPPSGIMYTKLNEGDYVKDIMVINAASDIIVYSSSKALRINMSEVPHLKRNTQGSRTMNTNESIDGISLINSNTTDIVVVTEGGKINRFSPTALPISTRGRAGNNVIKLAKGDRIKTIYGLNARDSIRVVTKNDKIVIPVVDIPEGSSISAGTKMISTKGDIILRCDFIKNKN